MLEGQGRGQVQHTLRLHLLGPAQRPPTEPAARPRHSCMPTGPGKSRAWTGGELPTGSSSRLKHLDYVGYLNFSCHSVSFMLRSDKRDSKCTCHWLTAREMASHSLPLESLPLHGRKSSPGHPTKRSHCSQLPTESNPAQHSD